MNIDINDEILQDFLVEAGEILEQLGVQLVELEQEPGNIDLLNSVFRGFHTIKGGAGFVNLTSMVDVCHRAEDVFNVLRQGQRQADAELMDAILQVLDIVNEMFDEVRAGQEPPSADQAILAQLEGFAQPQQPAEALSQAAAEDDLKSAVGESKPSHPEDPEGDTTDRDFEGFLDELQTEGASEKVPSQSSDEITDDKFEKLLGQFHGSGKRGGVPASTDSQATSKDAGNTRPVDAASKHKVSDTIDEDEFEKLLDQLHGEGKAPGLSPQQSEVSEEECDLRTEYPAQSSAGLRANQGVAKSQPSGSPGRRATDKPSAKVSSETTVRVDTKRLDDIMNLVGELVLVRNRLASLHSTKTDEEIVKAVSNLDMVTSGLQAAVMKTRMQPIKKVFGRFPRVVRDVARSLRKEVELVLSGEETDLDKNLVEALADPLVHLVRNAVDHGIETPDQREKFGKPRAGKVLLSASQEGDHILLTIEDDGKGMDADVLRLKAVEKGLLSREAVERLSDGEVYNLIFMAGFSTKEEISDVSGRGVGMDVVKTRIEQLNGSIEIMSEKGKGLRISIKVPLTLAILSTLMVVLGKWRFALPLSCVDEILDFDPKSTTVVESQEVMLVRQKALPVFYLRRWLVEDMNPSTANLSSHVVVAHVGTHRVGFVVDQLIGQEEVVIKPLGAYLQGLAGYAGATITGDGRIALILDVVSLMKNKARSF
jgi:two-component system chemotaxis sensor kinase CheA